MSVGRLVVDLSRCVVVLWRVEERSEGWSKLDEELEEEGEVFVGEEGSSVVDEGCGGRVGRPETVITKGVGCTVVFDPFFGGVC